MSTKDLNKSGEEKKIVPLRRPPSRAKAQEIIRRLVAEGSFEFHPHCKMRQKRRQITTLQVTNCLMKGFVTEDPYLSPHHKGWETTVEGSAAGERLKIVISMRWTQDILVITCYRL